MLDLSKDQNEYEYQAFEALHEALREDLSWRTRSKYNLIKPINLDVHLSCVFENKIQKVPESSRNFEERSFDQVEQNSQPI